MTTRECVATNLASVTPLMAKRARDEPDLADILADRAEQFEHADKVVDATSQKRTLNAFGGATSLSSGTQIEILPGQLQTALNEFAVAHAIATSLVASRRDGEDSDEETPEESVTEPSAKLMLGFGSMTISHGGREFMLTRQGFGAPSAKNGVYTTLALSHPERSAEITEAMRKLCSAALIEYEASRPGKIALYSYSKYGWQRERLLLKRPIESVILPHIAKDQVLSDVRKFLDAESRAWYLEHGIPYKRTFLLYGPPGCGKSSLIRAVASHFDCSVCMTSLANRELEDADLRMAMCSVPQKAVVAFEDVDALFGHHRERSEGSHSVTFSGLLNALDGVADPRGTVIFLTTNYKNRLDPALVRAGRCDVQVELTYAVDEQLKQSFKRFYKAATDSDAESFAANVRQKGGAKVTMSQLQEHFVQHRANPMEKAITDILLGQVSDTREYEGASSFYS